MAVPLADRRRFIEGLSHNGQGTVMTPKVPVYIQVRQFILDRISRGEFSPGDRLPSEMELAGHFNTTRSTVVHGLQSLVTEGIITREAGRGTFVALRNMRVTHDATHFRSFEEEVEEQGAEVSYRLISFNRVPGDARSLERLELPPEAELYILVRTRLVNGVPTVQETRLLPLGIASQLTIDWLSSLSMYTILDRIGRPVARVDGVIRAAAAQDDTAVHLGIKTGSPVLMREYTLFGHDGRPMVCGSALFRKEVEIAYSVDTRTPNAV